MNSALVGRKYYYFENDCHRILRPCLLLLQSKMEHWMEWLNFHNASFIGAPYLLIYLTISLAWGQNHDFTYSSLIYYSHIAAFPPSSPPSSSQFLPVPPLSFRLTAFPSKSRPLRDINRKKGMASYNKTRLIILSYLYRSWDWANPRVAEVRQKPRMSLAGWLLPMPWYSTTISEAGSGSWKDICRASSTE